MQLAVVAVILAPLGCTPAQGGNNSLVRAPVTALTSAGRPAIPDPLFELRGDPRFSPEGLAEEARVWYDTVWESIRLPEQRSYIEGLASSDNLYEYSRLVHTYVVTLLFGLRVTGDLAFLDEVDRIVEIMREQLDDSWRGTADRQDGERDGYLNWVWRNDTSDFHKGKDLHETDEMRAHALIAEVAWAFHNNRDLASPAGIDYGARADFWREYLRDHFEAKWRKRNAVRWPQFPFLSRPYVHPTTSFVKYHYYMHRLTGRGPYLEEAKRLSDLVFTEIREVETESGTAFVWPRPILADGGSEESNYLMPTTYMDLVILDAVDLYLEGFYGWGDARVPERFASTLAEFVIDNGPVDFARDIGGGQERAGIRPSSAREWTRQTASQYSIKAFALLAPWDPTGEIEEVSRRVYEEQPPQHRYLYIPTGLLMREVLRD